MVLLVRLTPLKNPPELPRRSGRLGHQHDPAGFTIQSRHNPKIRPIFDFVREELFQSTEKRRLRLAIRRMDDQRRGFIHHDPVIRLVDHAEIDDHLQAHDPTMTSTHEKSQRAHDEPLAI